MSNNKLLITSIGKPEKWLVEAAAEMSLDISGISHEYTNYFVNHSLNRHGDTKAEMDQGQIPITRADIGLIPEVIKDPNYTAIGIKRHGVTLIAYAKFFTDWTMIYLEEVLNSRKNKALRSATMFKKKGKIGMETFIKILSNNAHTDVTGIKKVVGAGGNPGEEVE
jgi:hypothetical protein